MDPVIAYSLLAVFITALFGIAVTRWPVPYFSLFFYLAISSFIASQVLKPNLESAIRDIFFVAPAYLGFLRTLNKRFRFPGIPKFFEWILFGFCMLVLLQLANPLSQQTPFLASLASVRTWILFAPFLYLSYALITEPHNAVQVFRVLLVSTWLPLIAGLTESMLIQTGYLPNEWVLSTFATAEEYRNFILLTVIVGYCSFGIDTSAKWRDAALTTSLLAAIAVLFSGQHQVLLTLSVVVLMLFGFHLSSSSRIALLVSVLGTGALYLSLSLQYADSGQANSRYYQAVHQGEALAPDNLLGQAPDQFLSSDVSSSLVYDQSLGAETLNDADLAIPELELPSSLDLAAEVQHIPPANTRSFFSVIDHTPLGAGTGSSLNHLTGELIGPRSYFGQAAWELGVVGVVLLFLIFAVPYGAALSSYSHFSAPELRASLGGCMTYLSLCLAGCATHNFFRLDANQLFFWVFVGVLFRLHAFRATYRSLLRPTFSPYLIKQLPTPAQTS